MRKTILFFTLFLLVGAFTLAQAQVTIGSDENPVSGALLQLKQTGTTTKGLVLSRVKLTDKENLFPMFLSGSAEYSGANKVTQDARHIGLIVYNTNDNFCSPDPIRVRKGLYVWTGTYWQAFREEVPSNGAYEFTDARDNEVYLARNFGAIAGDWMLENLRYVPNNIDAGFTGFTHNGASSTTSKYYAYAEGPTGTPYNTAVHPSSTWTLAKKNGMWYNWLAATNGQNSSTSPQGQADAAGTDPTPRIQGICPEGWHLPSDKEWNDLEKQIYENTPKYAEFPSAFGAWNDANWSFGLNTPALGRRPPSSANDAHGTAMKSPCRAYGSNYGYPPTGKSFSPMQGGFNVILTGYIASGSTANYGGMTYLWSSSTHDLNKVWARYITAIDAEVARIYPNPNTLYSVRCKKN